MCILYVDYQVSIMANCAIKSPALTFCRYQKDIDNHLIVNVTIPSFHIAHLHKMYNTGFVFGTGLSDLLNTALIILLIIKRDHKL